MALLADKLCENTSLNATTEAKVTRLATTQFTLFITTDAPFTCCVSAYSATEQTTAISHDENPNHATYFVKHMDCSTHGLR
ncbi:hypothetical protein L4C39_19560 [Vibrio clamense]|uniref:hypothetical protein n=1 Tax=Vibrio clamense TaxID=2910254 RepID=UPI003D20F3E0